MVNSILNQRTDFGRVRIRAFVFTLWDAVMVTTTYVRSGEAERDKAVISAFNFTEGALYVVLMLFFSGAVIALLFTDLSNLDQENPLARLAWYPVYGVILLLVLRTFPGFLRMAVFSPILILCVLWCGVTFFWSVDTGVTMRRSVALMITTMAGLVFAARFTWSEMVQRLALTFSILAFVAIGVVVMDPARGIMSEIHPGAWRGPWVEKNYLGGMMTKGMIACLCAFAMRPDRFWIWLPSAALCFSLVLMSTSKTALLISLAAIGLFVALRIWRRFPVLRIPVFYLLVASVAAFVISMTVASEFMFDLIGKDPTFTGRTDIWNLIIASIEQEWLMGYGYGAYWINPLGPSYYVRFALDWGVPSAHNGWLDLWLAGGVVAVALFALHMLFVLGLMFDRIFRGGSETYWVVLSTLMFFGFSLSESSILMQNDISWVMFVATSAKLMSFEKPFWRRPEEHPTAYLNV